MVTDIIYIVVYKYPNPPVDFWNRL